jgi:hypothetical protein
MALVIWKGGGPGHSRAFPEPVSRACVVAETSKMASSVSRSTIYVYLYLVGEDGPSRVDITNDPSRQWCASGREPLRLGLW